jgi:hypothetical protein
MPTCSWTPDALAALLALQVESDADLLTVWPTQETRTWAERLIVPLMALAIWAYLPIIPVHYTSWPAFAAANGQCLLFTRAGYRKSGGHTAVRDNVVEDVALARRIKGAGGRLRMADGGGLVGCRMYDGWTAVRDGFAKNILAGHGKACLSTPLHDFPLAGLHFSLGLAARRTGLCRCCWPRRNWAARADGLGNPAAGGGCDPSCPFPSS